ncbi:copper resistance D family protein [Rhodococcus sp. MTM3W5.2]|nr:copper resistance D family protein [Rhodococcus sp. MTM3W5.2]
MASPELAPSAPSPIRRAGENSVPIFVTLGIIAGLVAAIIVGLSASDALVLLGIPDPGPLTTYGLPAVKAAGEVAAVLAIGSLLLAAFLVPPQRSGVLDVDGYRAVRTASNAAIVWAACALVLVPLTVSDTSGQPLSAAIQPANLWKAIPQIELAGAWRSTAILAVLLAVGTRLILRWSWTPALLLLGVATLMPLALTGHSSSGGSHDLATNSLIWHLVAAALWAGGLFALLAHARRRGAYTDVATRRFSNVATVAFVVMAISGVLNGLVRLPLSELFTSTYGWLLVAKTVALVVLGVFGYLQRRSALPALAADPTARGPLIRFAGGEAIIFAATIGIAVGLGRTPPPRRTSTRPRPRCSWATTWMARRRSRSSRSTGASTSSSAPRRSSWRWCTCSAFDGCASAGTRGRSAAPSPGCLAARRSWSPPRRAWAGTRPRCSACTWVRTWRCRCSRRCCWCSAAR